MLPMESISDVLDCYPGLGPLGQVRYLANAGGFSGSLLWRIDGKPGDLCLRRWPLEHPSLERLTFIHDVLKQLRQSDLVCIPIPFASRHGPTFIPHGGHHWELTPWMPGQAKLRREPIPLSADECHDNAGAGTSSRRTGIRPRQPGLPDAAFTPQSSACPLFCPVGQTPSPSR